MAAYSDRLYRSVFVSLHEVIGRVLPQSIHKLLKSYPQKNTKRPCFFCFPLNPHENTQVVVFIIFYFCCLGDKYVDNYRAVRRAG